MPTRTLLRLTLLAGLAAPLCAFALGIGPLNVRSALNQNFEADIPLIVNNPSELKGLTVRIPRQQEFDQAGIERLAFFSKLRFTVETPPGGPNLIKIRSIEPIREPNFNLLLEVIWPRGRLLRDFPIQVDPQLYSNRREPPPPLLPALPLAPVVAAPAPAAARRPALNLPPAPPVSLEGASDYGPVKAGETLLGIASRTRPSNAVSMPQMMAILVANNPGAFANGDANSLRRGAVLKVPTPQALGSQTTGQAALADAGATPPATPATLDTSPSSTTTNPTISSEPTSAVTVPPVVTSQPNTAVTVPPVATPPPAPVTTPPVTAAVSTTPEPTLPTATSSSTALTPPAIPSGPSVTPSTLPATVSPTGQPVEIVPQASVPPTETTSPTASTASGTTPVSTQTPPAPTVEPAPKAVSRASPPKPAVKPVVEAEPSFLENPMVWLAIALILFAILAMILLPLLRRPARAKAAEKSIEFPVDPTTKTTSETTKTTSVSTRPIPVNDSPTRPLIKQPMETLTAAHVAAAAVPVVAAGAAAVAPTVADSNSRSVNQLLKEIEFGADSLGATPTAAAATPAPVIDRRTPLPDSEPATSPESRKPPTPLAAAIPSAAALAQPNASGVSAPSDLPLDLRMDDFDFEFGSLGAEKTGSQSIELPPLEMKPAASGQKGLGLASRIDQSEPVTEPASMTAISDILSAQASKDDRLDTMRVPSAGDAPTFDLDSRPSTSQLFELPPLEMKMASPVAQEPAQRLPIGIDRSEPVTEPASSLSNLLDDESLLDQTASVGGKRPVAAPTHKFEFADIAKELDQRAGEAALKLDQDLSDFDDRTIEFGKVDPQRQDATTVGATADYIETKLDLATAYLDMGDQVGARSLLDEVLKEGDPSQKERAAELLRKV